MTDIIISQDPLGGISVLNRRLNSDDAFEAALSKFLFEWNCKAAGLNEAQIEERWKGFSCVNAPSDKP